MDDNNNRGTISLSDRQNVMQSKFSGFDLTYSSVSSVRDAANVGEQLHCIEFSDYFGFKKISCLYFACFVSLTYRQLTGTLIHETLCHGCRWGTKISIKTRASRSIFRRVQNMICISRRPGSIVDVSIGARN